MVVAPEVSRTHVEGDLAALKVWAELNRWVLDWRPGQLLLGVSMRSAVDGESYELEIALDGYRALPPSFQFVRSSSGERGTHRCYPRGGRGYFHTLPVICAPWNRLAYAAHGGPHGDWAMANWHTYRANHRRLGDMLALVQELLDDRSSYQGRMAR